MKWKEIDKSINQDNWNAAEWFKTENMRNTQRLRNLHLIRYGEKQYSIMFDDTMARNFLEIFF